MAAVAPVEAPWSQGRTPTQAILSSAALLNSVGANLATVAKQLRAYQREEAI
jgi:hypothetical protein